MEQLTIKEFIQKTIADIENSLPEGYEVEESIQFEVSVTTNKSIDGGIGLQVVSGKISSDKEIVQKICFSIYNAVKKENDTVKSTDFAISAIGRGIKELAKSANISNENSNSSQKIIE